MLTHEQQRKIWGEIKQGLMARVVDYELTLYPGRRVLCAEQRIGETLVGKVYELTEEQLDATDKYYTDKVARKYVSTDDNDWVHLYVRTDPTKAVVKKSKKKRSKRNK